MRNILIIKIKNKEDDTMPLVQTEAFRGLWDEYERHGFVESETSTQYRNYMHNGWMCSVEEFDGKWKPLAYKKIKDKDVYMDKLPYFPSRDKAFKALHKIIGNG